MTLKHVLPTAGALAVLVSASLVPAAARTPQPAQLAQAQTTRQEGDARATECSRWSRAYQRLDKVRDELTRLQLAFAPTDDLRPKLDALIAQTNDAMTTTQERVRRCPSKDNDK